MTRDPQIDCVLDVKSVNGEGAVWSVCEQALYWVDVSECKLHRFDPAISENETWRMPEQIGCCALRQDGKIIVALATGYHLFDRESEELSLLSGPDAKSNGYRFIEGTVDPLGRFLAGTSPYEGPTMDNSGGTLFAFDGGTQAVPIVTGFHTLNGLAFSPDGKKAYISDSFPQTQGIWMFDHDLEDGTWYNKKLFFDTTTIEGRPDGAAIDSDGCYWMAGVSGWQILRITPEGKIDRIIQFPVEKPSRIAFGGSRLDTMYVTSLNHTLTSPQPLAGSLFALNVPGVAGIEAGVVRN